MPEFAPEQPSLFSSQALAALSRSLHGWEEGPLAKTLQRQPERADAFATSSQAVERLYTPLDIADLDYERDLGFPGEYPFTRGVQPTMYRGRYWTMRQYAGFGTAEESNEKFRYLLSQGQTGLSVAFDLPSQLGYDSDDPMAIAEVGQVGVAIDSLYDMETLFQNIPLDKVSTSMTINAPAAVMLAMYVAAAEKQGVSADKLNGTVQNDVLKEYVARGTYIFPPAPSVRLAADIMAYCARNVPQWNTISVSGYHIRDAGSTAAQEVGFSFANARAYIEAALERGLDIDEFAPRISWIFNTHNNFFEEIAKYRTLRRLWARMLKERYGAKDARSMMLRTHTQTGGSTLVAQQPENNIVRAAIQSLAAVIGGVQSIALSCFDEALALPTNDAQRIALRTQQVIAHETGVTDTIDPMAGSYFVEHLTNQIERQAQEYMDQIDSMGGSVRAIETGWMQSQIAEASWKYQQEVDEKREIIVGVNDYAEGAEQRPSIFSVDKRLVEHQLTRLEHHRRERDQSQVAATLEALRATCHGTGNLMPPILDAVRAYATLGEICGAMRDVFGEYHPPTVI
ncbi:MAG: methylmalonyl-CoA mutase family protein [Dehalococcoidia bacterium]|uniref:acyl-CoA mutase large subunit family protein n=1 Tax=Candidatus Amarobacter glycogenicus TaxID=3140699 RepID=UPI0031357208|nr:methylmalonyl-CoA mutase family protein [Dehalococcoidia bacterium]MCC6269428.1 methylmalonyl-CoA mutase family protein [Dehalococcoidia bacterium]